MILKSYYIQALVLGMENGKQCGLYHHALAHNIQQEALMPHPLLYISIQKTVYSCPFTCKAMLPV